MTTYTNNKSKGSIAILFVILMVALGILGYLYYTQVRQSKPTKQTPQTTEYSDPNIIETKDGFKRVTFSYTVKSIDSTNIVLNGDKGDLTLSNDPLKVKLYDGPTKESPQLELTALKIGNSVNIEFKTGESTSLFLSTM
jgi:archaellum component FlaF (FlaF/FlaG flagellin family)